MEHQDGDDDRQLPPVPAAEEADPTEIILAAVRRDFAQQRAQIVADVKEQALPEVQAAVKRALSGMSRGKEKAKKPRKQPEFKNKGNEKRYEANASVMEKIEEALEAIEDKDLVEAKTALDAGMELLQTQNKYIQIADREELGWKVVKHYMQDDLMAGDQKGLVRARKLALDSVKKEKSERMARERESGFRGGYGAQHNRNYPYGNQGYNYNKQGNNQGYNNQIYSNSYSTQSSSSNSQKKMLLLRNGRPYAIRMSQQIQTTTIKQLNPQFYDV